MECKNIYLLELLVGIRYINLDVKYKRRINAGVHVLHECAKSEYVFEWVVNFCPTDWPGGLLHENGIGNTPKK